MSLAIKRTQQGSRMPVCQLILREIGDDDDEGPDSFRAERRSRSSSARPFGTSSVAPRVIGVGVY
jgi:hypothetical protein